MPWKKPPLAQCMCMCLCVGGGWGGGVCVVNRWISGGRRRSRSGWSWMLTLVWSGKVQLSAVEVETFLLSAHTRANRHTEKHAAWQQCQTTSEVVSLCFQREALVSKFELQSEMVYTGKKVIYSWKQSWRCWFKEWCFPWVAGIIGTKGIPKQDHSRECQIKFQQLRQQKGKFLVHDLLNVHKHHAQK